MRILVVEDERRLAVALRGGLRAEGHAVDVAPDGGDAIWYAQENAYDVIVLDLMLPVMNGYEVCRKLRENGDWTPVLMLTARDADSDEVDGLDAGADDYMTKPFSFDVLLARLRSLARRGVVEGPTSLVVGDLQLDPATRVVSRAGQPVEVSRREFTILELLMRRGGAVVTKQQIIGNVWDFNFDGDPNIVEVYMGRLRRKIDRPFDRESIETVRGSGYRLRDDQ